jgi:TRAP-type C4-dicarboxylate transport system permease small subunit
MKNIQFLARWAAIVGMAIALAVSLMVVWSIIARALFSKPIPGDIELTQFGIALAISLALPWCQLQRANIIVDFFTAKSSPKTQKWLDSCGALLIAAMYFLLAWRTSVGAQSSREAVESTMILGLPMWWIYVSLAPGLLLAAVIALWQAAAGTPGTAGEGAEA